MATFASGVASFLASTSLELGTWTTLVSADGSFVKMTISGPGTPVVVRDTAMSAGTVSATMAHAFASWTPSGLLGPQISYVKSGLLNGTQIENIRATIDSICAGFINTLFSTPGYLSNTRQVQFYRPVSNTQALVAVTMWNVNASVGGSVFYPIFATAGGSAFANQPVGAFKLGSTGPLPARGIQVTQNNRVSIWAGGQIDMSDVPNVNTTELDVAGVICDSANPSTVEVELDSIDPWTSVQDCDIDIANSQSKFSVLGRYLVTPGE